MNKKEMVVKAIKKEWFYSLIMVPWFAFYGIFSLIGVFTNDAAGGGITRFIASLIILADAVLRVMSKYEEYKGDDSKSELYSTISGILSIVGLVVLLVTFFL